MGFSVHSLRFWRSYMETSKVVWAACFLHTVFLCWS